MTAIDRMPAQRLARYGYVPFMLIGLNGIGIALSSIGAPKFWLLPVLAIAIVTSFLVERPSNVAAALALSVAIQLLLQHSNADYRIGPAKYVLALNEGHRFHHLKFAGIGDVNFGLFTLIWDHLFRTYSYDPARRFGTDHLGMAAKPDYPTGYVDQLVYPFTPDGGCAMKPLTATAVTISPGPVAGR
ncbi:sterol desaturase family protein [Nocardia sp. NPDC049707]|uniref:sterol desaturase family protein n=1 Tax=Nocardia sp. NPDC049707 TaxID=3154735 RepID=UPI003444DEAB